MNHLACTRVVGDEELRMGIDRLYCTRFFRKRPVPTQMLLATLRCALVDDSVPLKLLFLWGVHGKPCLADDDHQALDFLAAFLEYLSLRLSISTQMNVVMCDTHGAVNRVDANIAEGYAAQVESAAMARGWATLRMSQLWQFAGISLDMVNAQAETLDIKACSPRLIQFARRYYLGPDVEDGVRRYLTARLLEKPVLSGKFQGAIHVTPVEPSPFLQYLQPELPEFYVWIKKRGCSVKPWFPAEVS